MKSEGILTTGAVIALFLLIVFIVLRRSAAGASLSTLSSLATQGAASFGQGVTTVEEYAQTAQTAASAVMEGPRGGPSSNASNSAFEAWLSTWLPNRNLGADLVPTGFPDVTVNPDSWSTVGDDPFADSYGVH